MKILHISDTHNRHRELKNLPKADVIVHSGDVSEVGTDNEVIDFMNWFCDLDYKHKIFIAGNHDFCLEDADKIEGLDANCHFLQASGVEIEGIKFWGVPLFFCSEIAPTKYEHRIDAIPADTDVLITHNPPYEILDTSDVSYGCRDLLKRILKVKPKYHLFGHIHEAYGIHKTNATTYINAAILDENMKLRTNKPFVVEL
jgi:Icc-related predicted phosphoesterase